MIRAWLCRSCFKRMGFREDLTIGLLDSMHCWKCGEYCHRNALHAVWYDESSMPALSWHNASVARSIDPQ
jgi:hypothetical protein